MKKVLSFLMIGTILLSLSACAGKANQAENSTAETALANAKIQTEASTSEAPAELGKISLMLDWYPNAVHAFIFNAIEKGYFQEEGVEVEIVYPAGEMDGITMTAAKQVDLGIFYPDDLVKAVASQNIPIQCVGAISQHRLNVVISKAERNIKRPKDLSGKTIGFAGTETAEKFNKYMIAKDGGDPEKTEFINVGFDLMAALNTDRVDATTGNLINHEVPYLQKLGVAINFIEPYKFGVADAYELLFVANKENIKTKSAAYKAFFRACRRGFEDMKNHPEESLELILTNQKASEFPLDPDVEKASLETLLPLMINPDGEFLSQKAEVWQNLIDFHLEVGTIDHHVDAQEIFTNKLLD